MPEVAQGLTRRCPGGSSMLVIMSVDPWRAALGEKVRVARDREGWSQRAAGAESGVAATTWRRLEAGQAVSDYSLIQVEAALKWQPGECFRMMAEAVARSAR